MWKMCRQKVKQVLLLCHLLPNFSLPLTALCSLFTALCSLHSTVHSTLNFILLCTH